MALDQVRSLTRRGRHLHRVDAEDVCDRCRVGGRPPPEEGDGAPVVEGVEHRGELVVVGAAVAVEALDRVVGQPATGPLVRSGDGAVDELGAPLPWCELGDVRHVDQAVAQVDDRSGAGRWGKWPDRQ